MRVRYGFRNARMYFVRYKSEMSRHIATSAGLVLAVFVSIGRDELLVTTTDGTLSGTSLGFFLALVAILLLRGFEPFGMAAASRNQ